MTPGSAPSIHPDAAADARAYDGLRPCIPAPDGRSLRILDQRALPGTEHWLECSDVESIARAIETLTVRGAPAIGIAASWGVAVCASAFPREISAFRAACEAAIVRLAKTRPTAVNLFVALAELRARLADPALARADALTLTAALRETAAEHELRDRTMCMSIARWGAPLLASARGVLTHCNTGSIATAGYGTALGVIRRAWANGARFSVYADETRPLLQGARLTAWELDRDGIDVTLLCDSMAGWLLRSGRVQAAIVGADRIATNGDTANKIGTYMLAVACHHHQVPLYVAAPSTTLDPTLAHGDAIEIEQRAADEVRCHAGTLMAPPDVDVFNPAFDVTPAGLITAIITEHGVFSPARMADVLAAHRRSG